MLKKKFIVATFTIMVMFSGIIAFAQPSDEDNQQNRALTSKNGNAIKDDNEPSVIEEKVPSEGTKEITEPIIDNTSIEESTDLTSDNNKVGHVKPSESTNSKANMGVVKTEPDTIAPLIELNGDNEISLQLGDQYKEEGATANEKAKVVIDGKVNSNIAGIYEITYTATDKAGNKAIPVTRRVMVKPVIAGEKEITIELGESFEAPVYYASLAKQKDNYDVTLTEGFVNPKLEGIYEIIYTYTLETPLGKIEADPYKTIVYVKDSTGPIVNFEKSETIKYAKKQTANVSVSDLSNIAETKYLWSLKSDNIYEEDFAEESNLVLDNNGKTKVTTTNGLNGICYLWILTKDNANNMTIQRSDEYYLDNTAPIVEFDYNDDSTIINLSDVSDLKQDRIRYEWTTGARPTWTEWFDKGQVFEDGDKIMTPALDDKIYYLWVMTEDVIGNRRYVRSKVFKAYNPVKNMTFIATKVSKYNGYMARIWLQDDLTMGDVSNVEMSIYKADELIATNKLINGTDKRIGLDDMKVLSIPFVPSEDYNYETYGYWENMWSGSRTVTPDKGIVTVVVNDVKYTKTISINIE